MSKPKPNPQPDPHHSHGEQPSTYFVQDRSNLDEMARLEIQGRMATAGMGGVLPEQSDPTTFQTILDIGTGPGDWLIETAKTYPAMKRLIGIDISEKMLARAHAQAAAQQVTDRVEFQLMDALKTLAFPDTTFDLVNQRLGMGWIRKWDWPNVLSEYQRVCKPGGVIRITESDMGASNSPALNQLNELLYRALYQAGNFFTESPDGVTSQLARLLSQHGIQHVQTRAYKLEYRFGSLEAQSGYEDAKFLFRTAAPFLSKWTRTPDNYEALYQQMLKELQQPDFVSTWSLLTVWGTRGKH